MKFPQPKELKRRVKDFLNIPSPDAHPQGSNPQKDASSVLDAAGTNQDIKDEGSNIWNDASCGLLGRKKAPSDSVLSPLAPSWEPDSNFLHELHEWNKKHEDDKLPAVLEKVNSVLESEPFKVALEFIPDIPFPAKSLVKAMVSLFLLGSKIPQAKQDIYNFSNQIVVDISQLADVFGETRDGQLSRKAWEDLQETRNLVNKVCKSAHDRLYRKRWNTLSAEKEVKEFKAKLDDARSKFMQIGIIRALGALDAVINSIKELQEHDQIVRRLQFIEETFGDRVVPQAKYTSKDQKRRECHEETRRGVLDNIRRWSDTDSDTENCWWITGKPGVGKSTIGARVAEIFKDEKSLYAQYFVTRNIADTTDPDNIIPTMAQQLAKKSPLAALIIQDKLETTPLSVVEKLSVHQAQALLLEPLRAIARYTPKVVVVIDGVDELVKAELSVPSNVTSILSQVTSVLCSIMLDLPTNVKILIFSRPEQTITDEIPPHIKRLVLATEDSIDDVDQLVRATLRKLAKVQNWSDWPSEDQVSLLCRNAAGHLGWAATVLRWIVSQVEWEGSARRDEVIEEVSQLGTGEIDELYAFILRRILPPKDPARGRYLKGLKTVLGCLVVLQTPLDIGSISKLLSLDDFDVPHCMKRISSLITDGGGLLTERTVAKVHKSFVDYLVSSRPDLELHIDPTEHHHSLTTFCFKTIQTLTFNVGHITTSHKHHKTISSISRTITYPCEWLGHHLKNGGERATLVPDVENFMKNYFLQWLEVLSLQGMVDSVSVSMLEILEKQIKGKDKALTLFIDDAIKFVNKFRKPIATNAAHIYISALPLAPSHSLVSQHYLPQYPHTLSVKEGPQTWDEEKPARVERACLSLDGTRIAAVFADRTLCIYDTTTGEAISSPFKIDENPRSVVLSRDGKLVASGGEALRLWNVETGKEVESFDINVYSLALSPDGKCIAAGCEGKNINMYLRDSYNIRVINLELEKISSDLLIPSGVGDIKLLKGEVWPSPFKGHEGHVYSVAYSADGEQIASSSNDWTVRVWDVSTGSRRMFRSSSLWTYSVAFSPDGTQIVSDDALYNLSTGSRTRLEFQLCTTFSPDGRYLASGSFDAACQIWDISTHHAIKQHVGHRSHVFSVAFLPDGKRIMSVSNDGTIRVSDIELQRGVMEFDTHGEWIVGTKKENLFWDTIPFRYPRNTLVIGECLNIDFSNFVHGNEWVKCREPLVHQKI